MEERRGGICLFLAVKSRLSIFESRSSALILGIVVLFLNTACHNAGGFKTNTLGSGGQGAQQLPGTVPVPAPPEVPANPAPPPTPVPVPVFIPLPLLWDKVMADGRVWSNFLNVLFQTDLKDTLDAADDMTSFCPAYKSLSVFEKANVWSMLLSAMSKYESNFNPISRMQETTMGTDPVTNLPVYSEGLLQLSYQDITGWPFCRFDWNKDKHLSPTDPKKTILNPLINLDCGARILADQVQRHHRIIIDHGAYWAVIKLNGKYQKITAIEGLVKSNLSFCQ